MKSEISRDALTGEMRIQLVLSALERMEPQIIIEVQKLVSEKLAAEFLEKHSSEVLARIPVDTLKNRVIALAVNKFGLFIDKESA